jgi:hypothetical protein
MTVRRYEVPLAAVAMVVALTAMACRGGETPPQGGATAPGSERTTKTGALETGAAMIQDKAPVDKIAMYLDGFHVAKHDPAMQMAARHYCNQVNEDFAQCVLFDANTADARMNGIEYIISEKLYGTLPADEKAYWHPHNYEILSGTLRMPGLPDAAEQEALKTKVNSYGKTWHTWMAGMHGRPPDPLPYGPAILQWSFNRDGEADPAMIAARDQAIGLNTSEARARRQEFVELARPQGGVDAMAGQFPNAQQPPPGVSDNGDTATQAVPTISWQKPKSKAGGVRP